MDKILNNIDYNVAKTIVQIVISVLVGLIMLVIYNQMVKKLNKIDEHELVGFKRKNKKLRLLNFDKTVAALKAYGALDKHPKLADPGYYLLVHATIAVIFGVGAWFLNRVLIIPAIIIGWLFLDILLKSQAKSEEKELMDDSLTICNMLMSQIKGGAYIGTAISECEGLVKNKRLKKAIHKFYISTATYEKTLMEAIEELESNFMQKDILTICMIVKQSETTGKSIDILTDLNKQIGDMQEEIYLAEKEKLNKKMTIAILLLFADIIGYVMYIFIQNIFAQM